MRLRRISLFWAPEVAAVRMRAEGQLPGMGPPRALDLKTRRAAPVNSSPAVGHPADAGPCPAQGSRTPAHKANSIPVNGLPVLILTESAKKDAIKKMEEAFKKK